MLCIQQNTYYLGEDYDPTNKKEALIKSYEFGEKKIPVGVFYKRRETYHGGSVYTDFRKATCRSGTKT